MPTLPQQDGMATFAYGNDEAGVDSADQVYDSARGTRRTYIAADQGGGGIDPRCWSADRLIAEPLVEHRL